MVGYSGTPLPRKLGIREGMTIGLSGAPDGFAATLGVLPPDIDLHEDLRSSDIFIVFGRFRAQIERAFHAAMTLLPHDGAIWVAWPKRSSGVETDLTESVMRGLFLPTGMVDNKVCAIDDIWSGLRFVVRKENRSRWPASPE